MIYLVVALSPDITGRPWARVKSQHERLQDAADAAIRLRKNNSRYEYRVQQTAEPISRNLVGWVYPLDEGETVQ